MGCDCAKIEAENEELKRRNEELEQGCGGRRRARRAPSEYNKHMGECLKGGKKHFKQCVEEWNKGKGKK